MQTFRKKYIYNPQSPIYSSQTARTYNCMNIETKQKKLIIIHHLKEAPFVQPAPGVLQPIQIPTSIQPYSVYPIVRCVSEIGKLAQAEAMYVIKCILESKIKKPMYSVVSGQGICCSEVEGILPSRSPDMFQLALDLLDLPPNLQQVQKSVVSKKGYSICRALKNNEFPLQSIQNYYGWRDIKKQKQNIYDDEFIIFKSRRKQQGPFGDQYGLAWHNNFGMCRMKYIGLVRDGYEQQWYKQFVMLMEYVQKIDNQNKTKPLFLKIHKWSKDESSKGIKIFTEIANQGTLSEYIQKKSQLSQPIAQKSFSYVLDSFIDNMIKMTTELKAHGLGTLHIKNIYMNNNRLCIGEPQLVTDKVEKKLRELKNSMDYYAPQFKENIILPENLFKLDREKMDIWSFGFLLHKIFAKQIPVFDAAKKPLILKDKLSAGMVQLISQCLDLNPQMRPRWQKISIKQIANKAIVIQSIQQSRQPQKKEQIQQIKLGTKAEKSSQPKSPLKKSRLAVQQLDQPIKSINNPQQQQQQALKLKDQQPQSQLLNFPIPIPTQISSRLKKIKLVLKIIIIMLLYIFVFFRVFLGNTITILSLRTLFTTATLKLVSYSGTQLSTITVITPDPLFFLKNDISFTEIQEQYQCINDRFDPIFNPDYSLLTYIHSSGFLGLVLAGWGLFIVICVGKSIAIWKGGISNRPLKKQGRFWASYVFYQLTLAHLLFTHFYVFEFFYFAGATPCLNISTFTGIQPFFDSSLFLFLQNVNGYFQQVFSTLGVLSILLLFSACFYSFAPKLQNRYFLSIPSILLRIIPYILLLLICRIGIFFLFSPTAINDSTQILPAIIKGSFQGFIGIVPEIFILITITVEVLVELFMYWCERKAAQSDKLAGLFNIKDKKMSVEKGERGGSINDMSIVNNSKQKLDDEQDY